MAKKDENLATETTAVAVKGAQQPPALVVGPGGQLPTDYIDVMDAHSGEGVSTKAADNLIPIIYLLQDGSPQVKPREPKYIQGAEAGDIILTSLNRLYKGKEGFLFQPCIFVQDWAQWVPRLEGGGGGAGYRGRHSELPREAVGSPDPKNPQRMRYKMPNGDDLIETRNHFGYILDEEHGPMPALLALSSTGHQVSRAWMTMMNTRRTPTGRPAPSWSRAYRLSSIIRKNPGNPDSFTFQVQDYDWVSRQQFDLGLALREDVLAGRVEGEAPSNETGGSPHQNNTDDDMPF